MSRNSSGAISGGLAAIGLCLLGGCSGADETPTQPAIELGALGAPDIERYEIYGTVCGFREGGGSIRALALIQPEQAWLKFEGETISLPVQEGAGEGPLGIGTRYGNAAAMLALSPSGKPKASGGGRSETETGFTLRTADGAALELTGILQCSAGSV